MKDIDLILKTAKDGAEKYFNNQMELLEKFSGIDCGTWNIEGNKKVTELICAILEDMGADIKLYYDETVGNHIVASIKPENATGTVILNAHTDTVFGEGFTEKHPFRIEGNYAYGLGIGDCKAGIAVSLYSVKILKNAGLLPNKEIKFIFNCDEEIGTESGSKIYEKEAKGAEFAFVFEGGREKNGVMQIITARKGVILGEMNITGKEAHAGAAYLDGRSAVLELAHKIIDLYSFNDYENEIYYNVSPIEGGRPNGIVAGSARAEFCCAGLPTNASFAKAEENIKSLEKTTVVDGCKVEVKYRTLFPAMEKGEQNHKAYLQAEKAAKLMGIPIEEIEEPTATDAAYLSSLGIPTADGLSALWYDIHTTNEHIDISSLKQRTEFFAVLLATME